MNYIKALQKRQQGFTLIELLLAMAFLTFMLLFVVVSLMQLIATYNKGIVYKTINQAGRSIVEEISRTARISQAESTDVSMVSNGRLCTGGKTYSWNIKGGSTNNRYAQADGTPGELVQGIIRVDDLTQNYCKVVTTTNAIVQ